MENLEAIDGVDRDFVFVLLLLFWFGFFSFILF